MVSSAPHAAFRDNHQGRHKRAAFVNTIDVRPLLIRLLADDSRPVHQSKTSSRWPTFALCLSLFESVCVTWMFVLSGSLLSAMWAAAAVYQLHIILLI